MMIFMYGNRGTNNIEIETEILIVQLKMINL